MRLAPPLGLHPATQTAPRPLGAAPARWRAGPNTTANASAQALAQTATTASRPRPAPRRWPGAAAMLLLHLGGLLGAAWWPGEQAGPPAALNTSAHPVVMLWRPASPAPQAAAPSSRPAPAPLLRPSPPVQPAVVAAVVAAAAPEPPLSTPPLPSVGMVQTTGPAPEAPAAAVSHHAAATLTAAAATAPHTPTTPAAAPAVVQARADHQRCPRPSHPAALRERGIEGLVQLRVLVDSQGQASQVQLLASSGWRLFDEAALAMARGCRFHPARQADRAVDSWVEFPVRFALQG